MNKETIDSDDAEVSFIYLVLPEAFDERKEKITQQATDAYICGVATKLEYRGKGLASGLLQQTFQSAATSSLREIVLGTSALNKSAVRAYERAGMVETKRFSSGRNMIKQVAFVHDEP